MARENFWARENVWLWLGVGCALLLTACALALWAAYGPQAFVNSLTAIWMCF
jgi:hypothetical protein